MISSIRAKLLLTLLLVSGSVVLCMYGVMQWSFDRGFLNYIHQQEAPAYEQLASALSKEWQKNQSWDLLTRDRRRWDRLLIEHFTALPEDFRMRRPRPDARFEGEPRRPFPEAGRPPPPPDNERVRLPFLLDNKQAVLIGRSEQAKDLILYPIVDREGSAKVIGYLGQRPMQSLTSQLDRLFVAQQSQAFLWVSAAMLLLTMLGAIPLAGHFGKPIRALSQGTRQLMQGHFDTRIPVDGRDELAQLAEHFNALAAALQQNEHIRRQWVADISHELRTPLAVLRGEIEAMQDGVRPLNVENLGSLHGDVMHLHRLVNDLYELSMSDIGALNYHKTVLSPWGILQECVDSFQAGYARKQLTLSLTISDSEGARVLGDADRLKQLFANLLKNSLRYTDGPGRLEITADISAREVVIAFNDSSPGVPVDDCARLFERLFRMESSRNRASGGAGLGLAICRNIVDAHGGQISAEPSPLGGVCITLRLPRTFTRPGPH